MAGKSQCPGRVSQTETPLKMSQIETLGILDEIQALVSDHLQVVSYKWLSRNFLVSSNAAKRLLEEFVQKHGSGLEVVYTLSGWLKSCPPSYNIRLVSGPKLPEAKQEFDNCSIQVYSVQASIPKDPAALWNAEFVQAEELFKQPSTVDNCLRDNRFSGISNSFVKRNVDGTPVTTAAIHPGTAWIPRPSKNNYAIPSNKVPPPQQNKVQQSSPTVVKDIEGESNGREVRDQATKPSADEEKIQLLPAGKKKGQNDKNSSVSGGSLANLWGRASAKSKPDCAPADDKNLVSNSTVSAEAQICAREEAENGSSDDAEDVNFRKASNGEGNRKRKVVFDLSDEDEYEDAVNLASPDPPKGQSCLDPMQSKKLLVTEKPNLISNKLKEDKPEAKEEKATDIESSQSLREKSDIDCKGMSTEVSSIEKTKKCAPENGINKDKVVNSVPNSPKRRKVLKTRIDERGREVTEVVWEGEEAEAKRDDSETTKKSDSNPIKKADGNTVANNVGGHSAARKSPALGSTAPANPGNKAGTKKAGNQKDPKQGNLLSFFKRV